MMRKTSRTTLRAAVGALVAAGVVVVAAPETASALPPGCTSTFNGNADWTNAASWDNGVPTGAGAIACIGSGVVSINTIVNVEALHLNAGTNVSVNVGAGLFVNGPTTSQWAPTSGVSVFEGRLGGTGRIEMGGSLDFGDGGALTDGSILTSVDAPAGTEYAGPIGVLDVNAGGTLQVSDLGLFLRTRYRIEIDGNAQMTLSSDTAFVAADYGTATIIEEDGRLSFQGRGGYYRGFPIAGEPLSQLVNDGTLGKDNGLPTVVDAWYVQGPTGHVSVNCCTILTLPDPTAFTANVRPDHTLASGRCAPMATGVCGPTTDPAIDTMSVGLKIPEADVDGAVVTLHELTKPPDTTDSRAVGNEVFAHAEGLAVDQANPATLTLRYSQADVMATPFDELQVAHVDDATDVMTRVPDCVGGAIPPGEAYCINREDPLALRRDAQNTYVTVKTTQTSRWHIRRIPADGSFEQTAPTVPTGLKAALGSPGDGSVVKLTWVPPADDGGAAPNAYKVFRDGTLVKTTDVGGQSTTVKNNGPGLHTFKVVARNIVGDSPISGPASIKLDKISAPRRVTGIQGAAGGKLTAGAKWRPPADAGGFVITGYQIKAFTTGGRLVATKTVTASQRQWLFALRSGRYVFKVRARNLDRWGPFSAATSAVSPR